MKRSMIGLLALILLLGGGWLIPHSVFNVSLETPAVSPTGVLPATAVASPTTPALPTPSISPEPDPLGELYFTIASFDQSQRLVRLPGRCVVGLEACPEPEPVHTPFDVKNVFSNTSENLFWSKDGKYAVLVTHPEDELSRGRTPEELDQLQRQDPATLEVSASGLQLFEAGSDTWKEIYRLEHKFIYPPVWSADGQWLAFQVRSSVWAFHQIKSDDGVYIIHPDGSGLQQLSNSDASPLGWIGNSLALRHAGGIYPATDYTIEMLSIDGQLKPLFASGRLAYYNLAPDGGTLLATDAQGETPNSPQKAVDLLALDGSVIHSFGVYSNQTSSIWASAWSKDGSRVAFANQRRVYLAERDGEPREIYAADDTYTEPFFSKIQFSPDQKYLLLDVYDGMPKFVSIALESGQATTLQWPGISPEEQPANFSWRP